MNLSIIKKFFNPENILDIGANVGQFYNMCKNEFPDAYYYLIEGNPTCKFYLNRLNVDYDIKLLSNEEEFKYFYSRKGDIICTGSSIYRENTQFYSDDQIIIRKLKSYKLDNLDLNKDFDLIKIDTQGSELDIMKGGIKTINKAKGLIIEIPLTNYNIGAPQKEEIFEFIESQNFYPITENIEDIYHPIYKNWKIQKSILFIRRDL